MENSEIEVKKSKRGRKPKKASSDTIKLSVVPPQVNQTLSRESLILQIPIDNEFDHENIISDIPFISKPEENVVNDILTQDELEKLEQYKKSNDDSENKIILELIANNKFNEIKKLISRSVSLKELILLRESEINSDTKDNSVNLQQPSESTKETNYFKPSGINKSTTKENCEETKTNPESNLDWNTENKSEKPELSEYSYVYNPNSSTYDNSRFSTIFDCLPGFLSKGKWPDKTNIHCWWCCFPFDTIPIPIPTYYNKKTENFKVFGCFCSVNCAYSYSQESSRKYDSSLLKFMYSVLTNKIVKTIKRSPPRESLNIFGGPLHIKQFRESSQFLKSYNCQRLPFTFLSHQIQEVSIKSNSLNLSPTQNSNEIKKPIHKPNFGSNNILGNRNGSGTGGELLLKRTKPLKNQKLNLSFIRKE